MMNYRQFAHTVDGSSSNSVIVIGKCFALVAFIVVATMKMHFYVFDWAIPRSSSAFCLHI
jgi:hypothetical protein